MSNNILCNNSMLHNTFSIHDTKCLPDGLYLCEKTKRYLYWKSSGISDIERPDDAKIYIEKNEINECIIKKINNFDDIPDKFWVDLLKSKISVLKYVKNQTPEICLEVVKRDC